MKTILLSAAASLMMVGAAAAAGGGSNYVGQNDFSGVQSRFVVTVPAVDTGSQAYPSSQGVGAGAVITHGPSFNRALLTHPDTGSQQMPVGLR